MPTKNNIGYAYAVRLEYSVHQTSAWEANSCLTTQEQNSTHKYSTPDPILTQISAPHDLFS
jgi:hypothetical protein